MQITPGAFRQRFGSLHLDEQKTASLLAVLEPTTLATGDKLLAYGQFNSSLYLVWSGRLGVMITSDDRKLTVGHFEPGQWVGEFGFIDPGKASADVIALQDSTVLALSQEGMQTLYERSADAASALLQSISLELAKRLRTTTSPQQLEKRDDKEYVLRGPQPVEEKGLLAGLCKLLGLKGA